MPDKLGAQAAGLLGQLVALPSVNPMGQAFNAEIHYEYRITEFLDKWLVQRGIPIERVVAMPACQDAPAREILVARFEGRGDARPTIMLEAHQDTVPVDGMTCDPFAATISDGRVTGRGSCDVKGSLACLLTTVAHLQENPPDWQADIVLAFTVNEEHGFDGARRLSELWQSGESSILPNPPDAVIVSEPTSLNVVTCHKGVVRWKCQTHGLAAHSSAPDQGRNAIYDMAIVLDELQKYATDMQSWAADSMLGRPTLSIGTIHGGISVNTVPDTCTIEIDRRLTPNESPETARGQIIDWLDTQLKRRDERIRVSHEPPFIISPGLSADGNQHWARQLLATVQEIEPSASIEGVPFGTDAAYLGADGTPAVVFGPGSIVQAHTKDEWIAVEQLQKSVEILTRLVTDPEISYQA